MRFLLDADLSPRLVSLFTGAGHETVHVDDLGHGAARDVTIGALARETRRAIVTGDYDFADIREFDPRRFFGIIVLTLPRDAGTRYIESLVRYLLDELPRLGSLEKKLLIVEPGRIRMRE